MTDPIVLTWAKTLVDTATIRDEIRYQRENCDLLGADLSTLKQPDEYTDEQITQAQAFVAQRYTDALFALHDNIQADVVAHLAFYHPKEN